MADTLNSGRIIVGAIPSNPFLPVQIVAARVSRSALRLISTGPLLLGQDAVTTITSPLIMEPGTVVELDKYQGDLWAAIPSAAFGLLNRGNPNYPIWLFFSEIANFGAQDVLVSLNGVSAVGPGQDFYLSQPATQFSVQTVSVGMPTYAVRLEGTMDGVNWVHIGRTLANATQGGPLGTISKDDLVSWVDGPVQHIRLNCTAFSGGGSLTGSLIAR